MALWKRRQVTLPLHSGSRETNGGALQASLLLLPVVESGLPVHFQGGSSPLCSATSLQTFPEGCLLGSCKASQIDSEG